MSNVVKSNEGRRYLQRQTTERLRGFLRAGPKHPYYEDALRIMAGRGQWDDNMRNPTRAEIGPELVEDRPSDSLLESFAPKHEHSGAEVAPRLFASSLRGGLMPTQEAFPPRGEHITLVLSREALPKLLDFWPRKVMFWDWPDYGVPQDRVDAVRKIVSLYQRYKDGALLEVACFGGHGRTGTVLAILKALAENIDARDAVERLRIAYCPKAVETAEQEVFVERAIRSARRALAGEAI